MHAVVYLLCLLTSLGCTALLARAWARTRMRLLFWSFLCFVALSANNLLLVLDTLVFPVEPDLLVLRHAAALVAVAVLLYGFIWEAD